MDSILIVDDQVGIRLLLKELFAKEGLATHIASNGVEAPHLFEQYEFDCVLLDVKMPGMDGIEVLKHIRSVNKTVPVFMMTAYGEQDLINQTNEYNVQKFFTKPFNIFDVRDTIIQLLNHSKKDA